MNTKSKSQKSVLKQETEVIKMTAFKKKTSALPNPNADTAAKSLASQPNNITKGFDVTKIDTISPEVIEAIVAVNDLAGLGAAQKVEYIKMLCASLGLNPLSRPLQLVEFTDPENTSKKRLTVYATKDCAEQLRKIHGVSIERLEREIDLAANIVTYTAYAVDRYGRRDVSTGIVALETNGKAAWNNQPAVAPVPLTGAKKANAIMKAETKSKRRVTLSICGLGFLDETQLEDLENAKVLDLPVTENTTTPNKAAEATNAVDFESIFAEVLDKSQAALNDADLAVIHDNYKDLFESTQQDENKIYLDKNYGTFRRILSARKTQITKAETNEQIDNAAKVDPKKTGLLQD